MQAFLEELGIPEETLNLVLERVQSIEQERDEAKSALISLQDTFSLHRLDTAIERALSDAGAKNLKAAKALLDQSAVSEDENGFSGIAEQITTIKKECPYLFHGMESASGMRQKGSQLQDSFTEYARVGAKL